MKPKPISLTLEEDIIVDTDSWYNCLLSTEHWALCTVFCLTFGIIVESLNNDVINLLTFSQISDDTKFDVASLSIGRWTLFDKKVEKCTNAAVPSATLAVEDCVSFSLSLNHKFHNRKELNEIRHPYLPLPRYPYYYLAYYQLNSCHGICMLRMENYHHNSNNFTSCKWR